MSVPDMMARDPRQIGMALRRARRAQRLTQSQLADKAGVTQATISLLENGLEGVKLKTVTDILAALGLELVVRPRRTEAAADDVAGLF
ncbi:helix-turn-helix domain-containing protein [Paracraurococcus lichenis]|uniref:Helix-turn-helix domain-containing protein n=1 Tax=Paracraurococcus lichenis TaxID=3064888 RepID=A0ABT9EB00_9PROT|nr:helix-turn-helix domain-containing protein [Paracraurococcus sp. LOR1-02]MDO9713085.1 helix-turn-helix domain-containing protein [Paracraurococcus sp. LOR1-02]